MIRIYCDSNIYRYLKPEHPSYSHALLDVFEALKDKMLFTFSDAHLDDLKDSKPEYALKDLELMGRYVKDNYFMHDLISKKRTGPYLATPLEAFKAKDYDAYHATLEGNPFNLDKLFPDQQDDEFGLYKLLQQSMQLLYSMPISAVAPAIETDKIQGAHKEWFDKILPGYNPMMTMGELMNSVWPHSKTLLDDSKEMTAFRRYIGDYFDRDEYSFEKFGMGFNEQLKQTSLGKTFVELVDSILTENDKKDPYQKFNRYYTFLEMYNITQEKQGNTNKLKKFDYQSLNNDALHAWYASFSDYLVTDDKGLQVKAAITYQLLGLPTKILSSSDFIHMKTVLIGQEETEESLQKALIHDLNNAFVMHNRKTLDAVAQTYKTSHAYFNYANRLQVIFWNNNERHVVLYCERCSHADFFMYRELETIVQKLLDLFGMDDEGKGFFGLDKIAEVKWDTPLRTWSFTDRKISIGLSEVAPSAIYVCITVPPK